jgi:MinD-like ATPase involved in chromosome partitioning or flagellar assembly
VLVACWSAKGGSGTTVVAAALGLLLARSSADGALLVDLGGDVPAVLGVAPPAGPGALDWLTSDAAPEALDRLAVDAGGGLRLVARGVGEVSSASVAAQRLADVLVGREPVVVDCGPPGGRLGLGLAAVAPTSLLVIRPCFLALRRAAENEVRPTGIVVVEEYGRSLGHRDIADALGVATSARIPWDPVVARAVDAGTLAARLPRPLARALRKLVPR